MLWVRGLPLESTVEDRQWELREQLTLEQAVAMEGYTHIPCFAHCLNSLVRNFLCHHHSV